jgi:hypothetical protein
MLRALLRFVGYLCLAVGFISFVVDGARSIANKEWAYLSIGNAFETMFPRNYAGWLEAAKQHLPPVLFDLGLVQLLAAPFFIGATVLAVLLLLLGKRPMAKIGYSNRD